VSFILGLSAISEVQGDWAAGISLEEIGAALEPR
jgi:hypothetical protein